MGGGLMRTPWWFPLLVGLICVAVSFPVDGLFGALFGVAGIVLVWIGWAKERRTREGGDQR
jgi:hypothetical protein